MKVDAKQLAEAIERSANRVPSQFDVRRYESITGIIKHILLDVADEVRRAS